MSRHSRILGILAVSAMVAGPAAAQFNAASLVYVPAVAHNEGVSGSVWRSDVTIVNADTTNVDVAIFFISTGIGNNSGYINSREKGLGGREEDGWGKVNPELADIPPRGSVTLEDIVGEYWKSERGGFSNLGALVIFAWESGTLTEDSNGTPRNILVESRTYNETTVWVEDPENEGEFIEKPTTYGQSIPGVAWYNLADAGALGEGRDFTYQVLVGGREDDRFRYNVGIFNTSDPQTSLRLFIDPFDEDGNPILDEDGDDLFWTVFLGPLGHIQYNQILSTLFGLSDVRNIVLKITISDWQSTAPPENTVPTFTCYGSIVDGDSGDPTTVLPSFEYPYDVDCMWNPESPPEEEASIRNEGRTGGGFRPARRPPLELPPRGTVPR